MNSQGNNYNQNRGQFQGQNKQQFGNNYQKSQQNTPQTEQRYAPNQQNVGQGGVWGGGAPVTADPRPRYVIVDTKTGRSRTWDGEGNLKLYGSTERKQDGRNQQPQQGNKQQTQGKPQYIREMQAETGEIRYGDNDINQRAGTPGPSEEDLIIVTCDEASKN